MGREAEAAIRFSGQSGHGKILLETHELILRGDIRARIARAQIIGFAADGDNLVLTTTEGPLCATLGAKEAALWIKALAKPPPSLGAKLGISAQTPARVLGELSDATLINALKGAVAHESRLIIAELPDQTVFDAALAFIENLPAPTFWGITRKGKSAFPEAELRNQMRAAGYIDSKSCAVSDLHTATRYARKTTS